MARYGQDFERNRRGEWGRRGGFGWDHGGDRGHGWGPGGHPGEYAGRGMYDEPRSPGGGRRRDYAGGAEQRFDRGLRGRGGYNTGAYDRGFGWQRNAGAEMRHGAGRMEADLAPVPERYRNRAGNAYDTGWRGGSAATRMSASDIMTEDPESVTPATTLADAAKKMEDLNVGIMPVVDDDASRQLRGVITDRDIAIRAVGRGKDGKAKVEDCMTANPVAVTPGDSIRRVFDVMKREQVRRVPVTDRDGRLVGIIAQADLAVQYAGLDLEREAEVEEVIERISEPARPRRDAGWR